MEQAAQKILPVETTVIEGMEPVEVVEGVTHVRAVEGAEAPLFEPQDSGRFTEFMRVVQGRLPERRKILAALATVAAVGVVHQGVASAKSSHKEGPEATAASAYPVADGLGLPDLDTIPPDSMVYAPDGSSTEVQHTDGYIITTDRNPDGSLRHQAITPVSEVDQTDPTDITPIPTATPSPTPIPPPGTDIFVPKTKYFPAITERIDGTAPYAKSSIKTPEEESATEQACIGRAESYVPDDLRFKMESPRKVRMRFDVGDLTHCFGYIQVQRTLRIESKRPGQKHFREGRPVALDSPVARNDKKVIMDIGQFCHKGKMVRVRLHAEVEAKAVSDKVMPNPLTDVPSIIPIHKDLRSHTKVVTC